MQRIAGIFSFVKQDLPQKPKTGHPLPTDLISVK